MKVAISLGGKSDTDVMKGVANRLGEFGVEFKVYVLSTHRVPEKLTETLKKAEGNECEVVTAGTRLAAHLPGAIASQAAIPVIGVPVKGTAGGLDALSSVVQMPKSILAATAGTNNSYNAGTLAVRMFTIKDSLLRKELNRFRPDMRSKFIEENGGGIEL